MVDSNKYVGTFSRHLHLEPAKKKEIISELQDHLEDKTSELVEAGFNQEEAQRLAMEQMGDPVALARQIREVHYVVCLKDVGLAVLPHLLLAGSVAFGLSDNCPALAIALGVIGAITWLNWRHGSPTLWSYSWLGFSLASPAIMLLMALIFPGGPIREAIINSQYPVSTTLLALFAAYALLAGWFLIKVVYRIVQQGWTLVFFSALPVAVLAAWALIAESRDVLWSPQTGLIGDNGLPWILAFLTIAAFTAVFLKLGPRPIKTSHLFLYSAIFILVAYATLMLSYHLAPLRLTIASLLAVLLLPTLRRPLTSSLKLLQGLMQTVFQLIGR